MCTCYADGTNLYCFIHGLGLPVRNQQIPQGRPISTCAKCQQPVITPKWIKGFLVCKLCLENENEALP